MKQLKKLGRLLKHLLSDKETIFSSEEVRAYVNAENLPPSMENVDEWWCQKVLCNKYATLCKVSLAALTVYHGPIVESTFSELSRILNKRTNRLTIPMLSAIQTKKYELKSNKCIALAYFKRSNPKTDPTSLSLEENKVSTYLLKEGDDSTEEANRRWKGKSYRRPILLGVEVQSPLQQQSGRLPWRKWKRLISILTFQTWMPCTPVQKMIISIKGEIDWSKIESRYSSDSG